MDSEPPSSVRAQGGRIRKIAMIGNHTPRQCGIATFTADLSEGISEESPDLECFVLAMNDRSNRYAYPSTVHFEIAEGDLDSYGRAADFLNVSNVDVVSVQHEYGIFGGKAGGHVLALLRELRMPIVTTLHTILADPSPEQRAVMDALVRLSERLVVMSEGGRRLLRRVHDVPVHKIDLIPHGIPVLPNALSSKERIGVVGNRVILTFGLLSPDKGIEHVIDALPAILQQYPEATYIVLGATHPHVKDHSGEAYRLMLESRARRGGVASSVVFHNRFVSKTELNVFLAAADLYITPYLNAEQITSGTLAYAAGSGKAVISTPYRYARELLADGRGTLVPWRDPASIARAALDLFGDDEKRGSMCRRAADHGREMLWPAVSRSYLRTLEGAHLAHTERLRTTFRATTLACRPIALPAPKLDHLELMTDGTGVLQHAVYGVPRREDGYCLDDNARALIVMELMAEGGTEELSRVRSLDSRYLAFVRHAWNPDLGRFRNFLSYGRTWLDECGSEDSHGRALWALGTVVGRSADSGRRSLGIDLFRAALPAVSDFTSPRAWAFALLGIEEYLRTYQGDSHVQNVRDVLAARLLALFQHARDPEWEWFEDRLTYCNARLSQALLVSGSRMDREDMRDAGLRSLEWLVSAERSPDGYFAPVGSNGFHVKGGPRARFDQQPVEAAAMVSACLSARALTTDEGWTAHAGRAFEWYLGQNERQEALYDAGNGGCRDGLHEDRVNQNQGAESTLSFLLALLEMRAVDPLVETAGVPRHIRAAIRVERDAPAAVMSQELQTSGREATR
jgi:glycosyltransferase involved in cell wall biosynthesis